MLSTRSSYQSVRSLAASVLETLGKHLPKLDGETKQLAQRVINAEDQIQRRLRALLETRVEAARIRCHGDYHLGQVLFTGGDFVIIDFEGEPARPLPERRLKRWALKDVAGMLRSFSYAAATSQVGFAQDWAAAAGQSFLRGYWTTAGDAPFVPRTVEEKELLVDVMLMEKALYELRYELDNRPDWVIIPLRGLASLVER